MKKLSLILVFITIHIYSQNCGYTWVPRNSGTGNDFYCIKSVSQNIAWAGGLYTTIRKTSDGGAVWQNADTNLQLTSGYIRCVEALDEYTAWIAISSNAFSHYIYKTSNGGVNWHYVYYSTSAVNSIKMSSSSEGIAFSDPNYSGGPWRLMKTTDGGENWYNSPYSPPSLFNEISYLNCYQNTENYTWFGTGLGAVYRSTDGGMMWTRVTIPGYSTTIFSVHFNIQTGIGFASGNDHMFRSTNFGANYSAYTIPGTGQITSIEGYGDYFWVSRALGIYKSTNGGVNWDLDYVPAYTINDIDLPNNQSGCLWGWAAGVGGVILKLTGTITGSSPGNNEITSEYLLSQNYPNPFNPVTNIKFSIPKTGAVKLTIFDVAGREVAVLVNESLAAGSYNADFDAAELSSGVYLYKLESDGFVQTKKMVLIK